MHFCLSEHLTPLCGTLEFRRNQFEKHCSRMRNCITEKSAFRCFVVTCRSHFQRRKCPKNTAYFNPWRTDHFAAGNAANRLLNDAASQPKRTACSATRFWKLHSHCIKRIASMLTLHDFRLPPRSYTALINSHRRFVTGCAETLVNNSQSALRNIQEGWGYQS